MSADNLRIPPGPEEKYSAGQDLLIWLGGHFARYGDTYRASVYGTNAYVTRDPDYAEHVLRRNWRNYVKGQAIKRIGLLLGNGLMVSEGDFWKSQRRMVHPAFHHDAVAALTETIHRANSALGDMWERAARANQPVNVTLDISKMTLQVVLMLLFGEDVDSLGRNFEVLSENAGRDLEFAKVFRSLRQLVLEVVIRRRKQARVSTDILGVLIGARDRDTQRAMSDHEIVNEVITLIVAGHETTASTLSWLWYLLSQHPEVEQKLSREIERLRIPDSPSFTDIHNSTYARQVIDETMRLYPAGWLMTRRALQNDRLGEYFVPAGTEIYIPVYFIQRNPALWEEPDRFNPDRFSADHSQGQHRLATLPFSAGPRNCIGEGLARLEMQIHLTMIARRLHLRSRETTSPEFDVGVNLRSKHDFVMMPEIKQLSTQRAQEYNGGTGAGPVQLLHCHHAHSNSPCGRHS